MPVYVSTNLLFKSMFIVLMYIQVGDLPLGGRMSDGCRSICPTFSPIKEIELVWTWHWVQKNGIKWCNKNYNIKCYNNNNNKGVCHTVALPFTLKSILEQKKNYGKFKYFTIAKILSSKISSKRNQIPSRYYNIL